LRDVDRAARHYRQFLERFPAHQSLILRPDEQAERYREAAIRDEMLLERVRAILRQAGVNSYRWLEYLNLARKLDKLARLYSGRSLQLMADLVVDLALARGLDESVAKAVRSAFCDGVVTKQNGSSLQRRPSPSGVSLSSRMRGSAGPSSREAAYLRHER
jgi:hypothetical protein